MNTPLFPRRRFLQTAAAAALGMPAILRSQSPGSKLNIVVIGCGGRGGANLREMLDENIVALCDVDWGYTDKNLSRLDTDVANLQAHIDHPDAAAPGAKPPSDTDPVKAKERSADP